MRRHPQRLLTLLLICLSVLAFAGVVRGNAAPLQGAYLPIVATGATAAPDVATVLECSCGYANAVVRPDGQILVMVQDYARGGKLFVYVDDGGPTLHEAFAPPLAGPSSNASDPAFAFPAQKNGPGAMVIVGGMLIIYAPARPSGVLEGPYNLMRARTPLASVVAQGP